MELPKFKVLISDKMAQEGIDVLKIFKNIEVVVKTDHTKEELIQLIKPFDGIIVRSATKLTSDVIDAAKNLKVIARAGTGYDNIDIEACNKRGIVVLITPLGNSNAVVELTLGLMLDFARNISRANSTMCEGKWEKKNLKGTELLGKTVGIIGLGRIGAGVAKRCQVFDMNVVAYDKFMPKNRAEELGVELLDNLDDLLVKADYITIHLPLTPNTKNLIDRPQFAKMKSNVVIVNVARGGVVNEEALYNALKEKKIKGACVDVYSQEPASPEKFPFIGLDNCVTTPHLGASTAEAQINVAKMAAQHLAQALIGNIYIDAVNVSFNMSEDLAEIYHPYMKLGGAMGSIISQYNSARINKLTIKYKGEIFTNFTPIKTMILHALFKDRLTESENVTLLNIENVLEENGINVKVEKYEKPVNFANYIKLYIRTEDKVSSRIAGTVFSDQPKIVEIDKMFLDLAPSEYMLLLKNKDLPGVVGKVGTFLGNKKINIASLQLGRKEKGTEALSIISIDEPMNVADLDELKKMPEIIEAKGINI